MDTIPIYIILVIGLQSNRFSLVKVSGAKFIRFWNPVVSHFEYVIKQVHKDLLLIIGDCNTV